MPDYKNKRCPQCGGGIDYFGSCRRCGREWTKELEEDELAEGLSDGKQHPSEVKEEPPKKLRRNKHTKSSSDKSALWHIESSDDETEIIKKRSLMRLDSRKIYNAMGLSLRAHEAQKAALLWLSKLWDFLSEEEQGALTPTLESLKRGYIDLRQVAQEKVEAAAKMEIEMEREHRAARQARVRIMAADAKRRREESLSEQDQSRSKVVEIAPGEDTEGYSVPEPTKLGPDDLFELAKERLANLDEEKALRKFADKSRDDDSSEDE